MTNAPDSTRPMRPSKKQPPPLPGKIRTPAADQPPPSASSTMPISPEDIIGEIEK